MKEFKKEGILVCGSQDCADMHAWGPGVRDCYIIHYIISGSGFFECDGKRHRLSSGDSFVIRPYTEVYYYPDSDAPWYYTWVDFSGEKYCRFLKEIRFREDGCVIDTISPEHILPLYGMLEKICADGGGALTAEGLLMAILGAYADHYPAAYFDRETEYFNASLKLIQTFYRLPDFDLQKLCEHLSLSRATLHRIFKSKTGTSPGTYLSNYRIERAKEFLQRGCSVKATAFSCGFHDPLYFSKVFRTATGIPPSEYHLLRSDEIYKIGGSKI